MFQDRKLQPSTNDGYRSAIADKLGNSPINVNKDENLTKGASPPGNFPRFFTSLQRLTLNPLKGVSWKHLTYKTVFLLVLGLGKCRIHAWQNKNTRHQSDWSKVPFYSSPSFLSKNQLAKEGPVCPQWLFQPWLQTWIIKRP